MGCPRCGRLPGNGHTEICALQGEIERLRAELAALQQMYTAQGLTIKRQQDELAECKQDAERYRYLRKNPAMLLHLSNREFDHAIDAARKGEDE